MVSVKHGQHHHWIKGNSKQVRKHPLLSWGTGYNQQQLFATPFALCRLYGWK